MNINNNGQGFTKIAVTNGEILPNLRASTNKSEKQFPPVLELKPPFDNQIQPIKPNPATSQIESKTIEASSAKIDLSNMTPIEFKQLMGSELAKETLQPGGSLDVMPYWENRNNTFFQDIVRAAEGPADQKMDILGVIKKAIEVKTSSNQPVELLEQTMKKLKGIDGLTLPKRIDFSA